MWRLIVIARLSGKINKNLIVINILCIERAQIEFLMIIKYRWELYQVLLTIYSFSSRRFKYHPFSLIQNLTIASKLIYVLHHMKKFRLFNQASICAAYQKMQTRYFVWRVQNICTPLSDANEIESFKISSKWYDRP